MINILSIDEIKTQYPDQWVLVGNPEMDADRLKILSATPIFHSKDKRELCYLGRDMTTGYKLISVIYTGEIKHRRKITGIFKRVTK
jgi:hypothetical protein